MPDTVLAGDLGGTNARLALARGGRLLATWRYPAAAFPGLGALLVRWLRESGAVLPRRACFAVAGPVLGRRMRLTNLPWAVDAGALERRFGLERVELVNDFAAQARAVLLLEPGDLAPIGGPGTPSRGRRHAPLAVLGPGSGLGEALLVWDGKGYRVVPGEGGHADFAPRTPLEGELWHHLRRRHGRVSVEQLLSGPGLAAIFTFLGERRGRSPGPEVTAALANAPLPEVVGRLGVAGADPVCRQAVELFCELLGAEAGNLALKAGATGGVYLAGGIAPRLLPLLQAGPCRRAFEEKGPMTGYLHRIPLRVVLHAGAGLLGAAALLSDSPSP